MPTLSAFASGLTAETAFDVLAVAKKLKAGGKDVIELQIGDSPYPSASSALKAGKAAIDAGQTRYCPSMGLLDFRATIARTVKAEFAIPASAENVVVAPGAKPFEQFFCELFLEPGDAVLVFQPAFPPYDPNLAKWLHRISVPTLLLYGDKDRLTPPQQWKTWAGLIPNAVVRLVKDAGHLVLNEKEEAPKAVLDFLST